MKALGWLVAGLMAFSGSVAYAHESTKPKHGGVVRTVSDITFELVAGAEGAMLHVEDHGKPVDAAGASGKLQVLNGSERSEAELKPAGGNRLEARGVRLGKGAKAVATLRLRGKTLTIRYSLP